MSRLQSANDRWYAGLAGGLRLITLGFGAWSLLRVAPGDTAITSLALLALVAVAATLANFVFPAYSWVPPTEAALAALAMSIGGDAALPLLPYLAVPAFAGGVLRGMVLSLWTTAATAVTLAASFYPWSGEFLQQSVAWLIAATGIGLLAGWVHLLRTRAEDVEQHSYEEATELLDDLRRVIRPLSGGLDPKPLAEEMLHEIAALGTCTGAAVFVGVDAGRELVATCGEAPDGGWQVSSWDGAPMARVPIARGDRTFGLLLLRTTDGGLSTADESFVRGVVDAWAPRLEAAALYFDVRELATQAERSRLAREMHDGVAQDVASLGYLVDDLAAEVPPELQHRVDALRTQLSEVVAALRLSIHDLRSEGLQSTGLAATISELARREAHAGAMRLHLRVQEGVNALPTGIEHDLYRIAQEALSNARRHSQAANLWVSCVSGPGGTIITVEDDGVGGAGETSGGLGMQTMTERALRIGARLSIEPRRPTGTMVRVDYAATPSGLPT